MISDAFDTALLQQWVGNTESADALIDARQAAALTATLDRPFAFPAGAPLPPLWHWIYFWTAAPQAELGPDGHPQRGGFLPPVPLPRRMWAGGRLTFAAPLVVGTDATRISRVQSVTAKTGASGNLAFVTVAHERTEHLQTVYGQGSVFLPAAVVFPATPAVGQTIGGA